jgi:very-short-patch-repair endonuclease
VLPAAWAGRAELDGISWECRTIDEAEPVGSGADSSLDEPLAMVGPIRGRPHPNSPGEQLLASRLGRDPMLGPLFEYNRPVTTVRDSRYQVDLVWFAGKIAVEIDGYRCHSSRFDFANDRQRDYELQLSGYLVLRLTHDSVMADVELAIDKVRDLVKLRLSQPPHSRPSA